MSRSDVEFRRMDVVDRDRASRILEVLKTGTKVSLSDLDFLVAWTRQKFAHTYYRHVKSGSIYVRKGLAVRVGDDDLADIVVMYSPFEPENRPDVVFTRPWVEFLQKFVGVQKVERWEP